MTQVSPEPGSSTTTFYYERWLESFLRVILRASAIVGAILVVASVVSNTQTILLTLYGIGYVALLVATFAPLSYRLKSLLFLFLLFTMGVSGLLELGVNGNSRVFFAILIIMAAVLFGNRATYYAIGATFIADFVVGALAITGHITLLESSVPVRGIDVWVMAFLTTTLLALVITTGQRMLIAEFTRALKANNESLNLLNQERSSLEDRIAERTRDIERRAIQLQVAADVGSAATRIRNLDELLDQITHLISERFNFYHVGIFLLDEKGEYAVLRSANSEGGQKMLSRGHKLQVGQVGIVGYVTGLGEPRVALDVGKDAVFFDNPDLPKTRSEMALPLIVGDKVLGALDVQSTEEAAFTEEDVTILKVMADQIAIAIDNARLLADTQSALDNTRRAYGEISRTGWQRLLREKKTEMGYISLTSGEVKPVSGKVAPEYTQAIEVGEAVLSQNETTLHLPIKVRGEILGVIRLNKPKDGGRWTDVDITLAETLAEQLGTALESPRLYRDISQRAERENVISDIASKISSSIQLDTILRNTVQELGRALVESEVILQIGSSAQRK